MVWNWTNDMGIHGGSCTSCQQQRYWFYFRFDEIYEKVWNDNHDTTDTDASTNNEEEEESTDADTDKTYESSGNDEDSVATEEGSESDIKEDDESSASNVRRLFVAVTSMLSTLLGSSV